MLKAEIEKYLLSCIGVTPRTLKKYRCAFNLFILFFGKLKDLREITDKDTDDFLLFLKEYKNSRTGRLLSASYRYGIISSVKKFFKYLMRNDKILTDPFCNTEYPGVSGKLPFTVLTIEEIEKLLMSGYKLYGLQGRAVIELLYGAGLRAGELCSLRIRDVVFSEEAVYVIDGKGRKDRVVPLVFECVKALREYLSEDKKGEDYVFTKKTGGPFTLSVIGHLIREVTEDAGIKKRVTPHVLRHTYATHLLEGGMDIRYIQLLLGHDYVSTTEIYTHTRDSGLIRVYRETHPRA